MDEDLPPDESVGLFFEKRAHSAEARFFRDLPGRGEADFYKSADALYGTDPAAALSESAGGPSDVSPGSSDMGTGKGLKKKPAPQEKTATPDPTYLWDEPVADGFHRPAREQPEALEHGGERFHASDADYGTGAAGSHSVVDRPKPTPRAGGPMGKHAAAMPRFLGTSFEKSALSLPSGKDVGDTYDKARDAGGRALETGKAYGQKALETGKELGGKLLDRATRYGGQALETLKSSTGGLGDQADEALDAASKHPLGAAAMLGGAGVLGAKAVGGAARGVTRGAAALLGRKKPVPKGVVERGLAGLSHLFRG